MAVAVHSQKGLLKEKSKQTKQNLQISFHSTNNNIVK